VNPPRLRQPFKGIAALRPYKKPKAKSTATAGNKKQKKQKMGQDASWDNGNGELRFGFGE
jgi:hypothetical protein